MRYGGIIRDYERNLIVAYAKDMESCTMMEANGWAVLMGIHLALEKSNMSNPCFSKTEDLGKYLGIPILHKWVSKETFHHILMKIQNKLSSWKIRQLSFAGRLTLTKFVLESLPAYTMHSMMLPRDLCVTVWTSFVDSSCEEIQIIKGRFTPWAGMLSANQRWWEVWD